MMTFVSRYVEVNKLPKKMHYLRSEPLINSATNIIFLHGFPESSYAWHSFLPHFALQGFNVFAPDFRGNFLSNSFKAPADFDIETLAEDIRILIEKYKSNKVVLIGHDLGGAVAWQLVEKYPLLCKALIVFNSPHPGAYSKLFRSKPWLTARQTARFWYLYFLQIKHLPEALMLKGNRCWIDYFFKKGIKRKSLNVQLRLSIYKKLLSSKALLTPAIAVYRRNVFGTYGSRILKNFFWKNSYQSIHIPVQMLWGDRDIVFENALLHHSSAYCKNTVDIKQYEEGGHWIHHEYLDEVMTNILDFFSENQLLDQKDRKPLLDNCTEDAKQLQVLYNSLLLGIRDKGDLC